MPATGALRALLAGPETAEAVAGLSSALPSGTRLRSLVISAGIATVDLDRAPDAAPGDTPAAMPGTAEIVYTLTRFSTISGVRIQVDGHPWAPAGGAAPRR